MKRKLIAVLLIAGIQCGVTSPVSAQTTINQIYQDCVDSCIVDVRSDFALRFQQLRAQKINPFSSTWAGLTAKQAEAERQCQASCGELLRELNEWYGIAGTSTSTVNPVP